MSKAVLSNRIYIKATLEERANYIESLTYELEDLEIYCDVVSINANLISLPIARTDLLPVDFRIIDKRVKVPIYLNIIKNIKLKNSQQRILDDVEDSCLIVADPGWGKTFAALAIAEKLKQKTLVVTHTLFLRDQWVDEVKSLFGFTPSIIGSGKREYDKPITIANIQTLAKMGDKIASEFGLIIIDEVHHMPATTFKKVLDKSKARYKIGLTGTLGRKDGKHVYIVDYFGRHLHYPDESTDEIDTKFNGKDITVIMHNTGISLPGNFKTPWAIRLNKLYALKEYKDIIVHLSSELAEYGHKVLTVADRVDFLTSCAELLPNAELIVGSTENRNDILAKLQYDTDIIFGTTSIFKEGISENILGGLVIGVPISNVYLLKQLVGRVLRLYPGKEKPVIIDPTFNCSTGKSQAQIRFNYYKGAGYDILVI